jgi:predicted transcriptional regulator
MMPMKAFRFFIFIVVVAFLGWGVIRLSGERKSVNNEVLELKDTSNSIKKENIFIADKIECLKNPENLVKELKS